MKVLYWIFIGWWLWPFQLLWKYREQIIATKFWKKWWFWTVVILCLIISAFSPNSKPTAEIPNETIPSTSISEPIETLSPETISTYIEETTIPSVEVTEPMVEETTIPPVIETVPPTTEKVIIYVYITPSGIKYHTERCRFHDEGDIRITEEEAINMGYEACKVCH